MTDQETPQAATSVTAKSSAVKAGWICLVLGFLTFWIFGFGFIFFAATFILAIVAMCTNRVGQGIVLLVSSVGSIIVCVIISLALLSSAFTAALKKERVTEEEVRGAIRAEGVTRVEDVNAVTMENDGTLTVAWTSKKPGETSLVDANDSDPDNSG